MHGPVHGPTDLLSDAMRFLEKSTKTLSNFQARKICHAGQESVRKTHVDCAFVFFPKRLDSCVLLG